jgi:hypothetical protein
MRKQAFVPQLPVTFTVVVKPVDEPDGNGGTNAMMLGFAVAQGVFGARKT